MLSVLKLSNFWLKTYKFGADISNKPQIRLRRSSLTERGPNLIAGIIIKILLCIILLVWLSLFGGCRSQRDVARRMALGDTEVERILEARKQGQLVQERKDGKSLISPEALEQAQMEEVNCIDNEELEPYKDNVRVKPLYAIAHYDLGTAYRKAGCYEEAAEAYKKAIRVDPDCVPAYYNLGVVYLKLEQYEAAAQACQMAIVAERGIAEAHCNLGIAYDELGNYSEAIKAYKKAICVKPNYAEAHCNLGITYRKLDRSDEAIEQYNRAIYIKEDLVEAHYNLGVVYDKLSRYEQAIKAYKKSIRIKFDMAEAHCGLGISYLKIGDKESALAEYKILQILDKALANRLYSLLGGDS